MLGLVALAGLGRALLRQQVAQVPAVTQGADDPPGRPVQPLGLRRRDDVPNPLGGMAGDEVVGDMTGDTQGPQTATQLRLVRTG